MFSLHIPRVIYSYFQKLINLKKVKIELGEYRKKKLFNKNNNFFI